MTTQNFAEVCFAYQHGESEFETALVDAGFHDFERIGFDSYDISIEFYEVGNEVRLTPDQQKIVHEAGFRTAYVNHKDGWETHYTWKVEFAPVRGWRRKKKEGGGFLISYWPESWDHPKTKEWLTNGYMTIEPDPFEIKLGG